MLAGAALVGATLLAFWIVHAAVIAEDTGLRWRGLGRWHFEPWQNVSDYYGLISPSPRPEYESLIIQTRHGHVRLRKDWRGAAAFQDAVQRHATQARVRAWGVYGTRPEDDWPRVFRYRTSTNRWGFSMSLGLLIIGSLCLCWEAGRKIPETAELMGWAWTAAICSLALLLVVPLFMVSYFIMVSVVLNARRRLPESIRVDLVGLQFNNSRQSIEARWDEINDYFVRSTRRSSLPEYVIVTPHGEITFSGEISEFMLLTQIVRRYATETAVTEWKSRDDSEALGGVRSRWSGGQEGVGDRIYHYRTRLYRAFVWGVKLFAFLPSLVIALQHWLGLTGPHSGMPFGVTFLLGLGAFWASLRYRGESVRTNESAISQVTLFRTSTIRWTEVQDYYLTGPNEGVVEGLGVRLRFGALIIDQEALRAEISRRAVHSRSREWRRRDNPKRLREERV